MRRLSRRVPIAARLVRHPRYARHLVLKKLQQFARCRGTGWNGADQVPPPLGYDLVLTWKCNLRCRTCMQWGPHGWCHELDDARSHEELPLPIIERLIASARGAGAYFVLFGGEPLLHSEFDAVAALFKRKRRFAYVCTNGTLLDRHIRGIRDNPYLSFLVALDGLQPANDAIRGAGVFRRVTENIALLKAGPRSPYVGVECTVMPENLPTLADFCRHVTGLGVDWVVLNLAWFISATQARDYESLTRTAFGVQPVSHAGYRWPYDLDRREFARQYDLIARQNWPVQISWMPPLRTPRQVDDYLDRPEDPLGHTTCYKHRLRCDVLPSGDVVTCKQFPDIVVGNLRQEPIDRVWNSARYRQFRTLVAERPLPVCSKCNALYLYRPERLAL